MEYTINTNPHIAKLVEQVMPNEDELVKRTYASLPYKGTEAEQELCLCLLYRHSRDVADLALSLARLHPEMLIDSEYLEQAALLHDIGVVWTDAPGIHCHGTEPYIRHGEIGHSYFEKCGLSAIAAVCASHVGTGMTHEEILAADLPLSGDHLPCTTEEKLICYADKFFSKSHPERRKTMEQARRSLSKFGEGTTGRFEELVKLFGEVD